MFSGFQQLVRHNAKLRFWPAVYLGNQQLLASRRRKWILMSEQLSFPSTAYISNRHYRDFGHKKPEPETRFQKCFYTLLLIFFVSPFIDWIWVCEKLRPSVETMKSVFKVKAVSSVSSAKDSDERDSDSDSKSGSEVQEGEKGKKKRNRPGFRDRRIIEYENRIRAYSTPDKIFRYFATLRVYNEHGESEIFMTPEDFLRSLTPGVKQPDGLGLDQFRRVDMRSQLDSLQVANQWVTSESTNDVENVESLLTSESIFQKLSKTGLINFSDYIFLLTVLSASRRHFEIAFRMFDLNGDGNVDYEEFEKVQTLIRNQTSVGSRHRDHSSTGNIYKGVSSALATYFFGEKLDQKLTTEKFLDFQRRLQNEILTLEFKRKEPDERGRISEADFAELLLAYSGINEKRQARMLKRVKKKFKNNEEGITLNDYLQFFCFLNNINDVDTALTFYHIAGASIDQATLKHVAKQVAHIDLRDHVIDVIFTLFDENMDGQLSNKEFVSVMKQRLQRGLERPKDTGFLKFLNSIIKCATQKKPVLTDV